MENIIFFSPDNSQSKTPENQKDVEKLALNFIAQCEPLESKTLYILNDARTGAYYCECHIRGSKLVGLGTTDVPLDPDEQSEYRANREIVETSAFERMKVDALAGRAFSNIVTEFADTMDSDPPLKILGGQHRFKAIELALEAGIDEYHGVKVYFGLNIEQRLDVQLISNTNIAVSADLLDRMFETVSGPQLRKWCHKTGLLLENEDFGDKRSRGAPLTVRAVRTFIINYYDGCKIVPEQIDKTKTNPTIAKTGVIIPEWEQLKVQHPDWWKDKKLEEAGKEFAALIDAQRNYYKAPGKVNLDFAEKALSYAIISAWPFVAGMLCNNEVRLKRHYALRNQKGRDPLNAAELAKGRHKTDPDNYRGLGYLKGTKERSRFVEIFFLQTERGDGITKQIVEAGIKQYHAKQAYLEAVEAKEKM